MIVLKEKIQRFFDWGAGTYKIVMKNKLVSIICFLIPGFFHTFSPEGSLRWDAGIMTLLLGLYGLTSFILVLTDRQKAVKGRELAETLVHNYFEEKRESASKKQKIISKNAVLDDSAKKAEEWHDRQKDMMEEKHRKYLNRSKIVLLIVYGLLTALSVLMFIHRDTTLHVSHVLLGLMLLVDGMASLVSTLAAIKSNLPVGHKVLALIISIFTLMLGVLFIVVPHDVAAITMRISGILLLLKGIPEIIVLILNRGIAPSVKDTIQELKDQEHP